jgi:hypothetical protein
MHCTAGSLGGHVVFLVSPTSGIAWPLASIFMISGVEVTPGQWVYYINFNEESMVYASTSTYESANEAVNALLNQIADAILPGDLLVKVILT